MCWSLLQCWYFPCYRCTAMDGFISRAGIAWKNRPVVHGTLGVTNGYRHGQQPRREATVQEVNDATEKDGSRSVPQSIVNPQPTQSAEDPSQHHIRIPGRVLFWSWVSFWCAAPPNKSSKSQRTNMISFLHQVLVAKPTTPHAALCTLLALLSWWSLSSPFTFYVV